MIVSLTVWSPANRVFNEPEKSDYAIENQLGVRRSSRARRGFGIR